MGSSKIFVGRLTSDILVEDLREYFSTLGEVTDCFIPKPFRGFGFVTFMDPAVAKVACQMTQHEVKGVSVHVETASPKPNQLQPGPKQLVSQYNTQYNTVVCHIGYLEYCCIVCLSCLSVNLLLFWTACAYRRSKRPVLSSSTQT